jgi:probable rRNA maturation factor
VAEDIYVQIDSHDGTEPDAAWFESVVRDTLQAENVLAPCEVGMVLTDQETVHAMNRRYRNVDAPTDVISFYTEVPAAGADAFVLPDDGVRRLGDVVISYPQAVEQAREVGHSTRRELTLLVIHGVLHLLGYDHEVEPDAQRMRPREAALLESFRGRYY